MAEVIPFIASRPIPEYAAGYAALPYDVVSRKEAAEEIAARPLSFLRIDKTTAIMPADMDEYDPCVYTRAQELLASDEQAGVIIPEPDGKPHYYVYQLARGGRTQTGVVACASVADYHNNVIKRHENTRTKKQQDRVEHIAVLKAHTGLVVLAYRPHEQIDAAVSTAISGEPLYDFETADGMCHRVWRIDDETITSDLRQAFAEIDALYIADGHHRAAAAVIVEEQCGGEAPAPAAAPAAAPAPGEATSAAPAPAAARAATGKPSNEAAFFLAMLFPAGQLTIHDYNRVVIDLNGYEPEAFLKMVGSIFEVAKAPDKHTPYRPRQKGELGMYLQGSWYRLNIPADMRVQDPVEGLDVSLLQNHILDPVLDIKDPCTSKRLHCVSGVRGLQELERHAKATGGVAFVLYPCSLEELFAVADAGELMPPKSTWFEPKPRSGLFIHKI